MLDAVLRRGQTLDSAAAPRATASPRPTSAGPRDRRRDAAPPARPRRADRQRDPPAAARRQQGADGAAPRARPEDRRSTRPTMRSSRPPCRWSTAARAGWSTACSARCCARGLPTPTTPRCPPRSSSAGARPGATKWSRPRAARSPAARRSTSASRDERRAGLRRARRRSLAPRHVRLDDAASVAELPGFDDGALVGAGPRRLAPGAPDPGRRRRRPRPVRRARRQDHAARRRRPSRDRARPLGKSSGTTARQSRAHRARRPSSSSPTRSTGAPHAPFDAVLLDAPCSATGTFRRHPEVLYRARPAIIAESAELQAPPARPRRALGPAGRHPGLCRLLARARGRRGAGRRLPRRHADFRLDRADQACRRRRRHRRRLAPHPARHARSRRRARRLLRRAPCPQRLIASNRPMAAPAHLPVDPVRRFRPARRGSARDRRGRRRLDPHRRDGRPFRPQPHHRPGGGEGAPPAHAPSRSTSI